MNHFQVNPLGLKRHRAVFGFWILFIFNFTGCGGSPATSSGSSSSSSCVALTGTPWVPSVSGVAESNHDAGATLSQTILTASGPIVGLAQAAPASKEITVSIDMTSDLGQYGSLTLMAEAINFPSSTLEGGAYAYLVSLNDGVNELINLSRAGSVGDCWASGYYSCAGSNCSANTSCTISSPSAFFDRDNWEEHQGINNSATSSPSVNIFPTCNWSGGTAGLVSNPSCGFNTNFFPANSPVRLRYGGNYTAKYVLLSDSYSTLSGYTAGLQVTVVKKTKASTGGAFDINLILVGNSNINASRTAKGKQNLNTLATNVVNNYAQTNLGLSVGAVNAIEWPCSAGGEPYANPDISILGDLFIAGGAVVPSSSVTRAINVYLVSSIVDQAAADANLTILGVDGAIGGPLMKATTESGMVVSTFDALNTMNASCPSSAATCSWVQQDESSFDLSSTVTHEMGHFLGLNHPSESDGTRHDPINDTPICTATETIGGSHYITLNSCRLDDSNVFPVTSKECSSDCGAAYSEATGNYCPAATSCQFNYVMWWTTKNFWPSTGSSDGNLFSPNESGVIYYHPIVQ